MRSPVRNLFGAAIIAAGSTLALPALAATSGANGTHDPSRMVESNGKFWVFSTGGGSKSSPDGLVWSNGPQLFPNGKPSWLAAVVPNDQGLWAPDAIYYNGQYFVFYSYANKACALGVLTSPTLDTASPSFKWTDRGLVVSNPSTSTYGTIDPAPVVDADNNLWLLWGSGYIHKDTDDSIYITRLDNATGLASTTDTTKPGYPLVKGHVEGSYMYYHAGYYYLWWNSGGCCSGASSTYTIHVARSRTITGQFTNARIFYSSTGSIHGPGHLGIYTGCGVERMTYHYYPDTGGSVLGENELTWATDGWPMVGPQSTTPIKPCGMMGTGGGSNSGVGGTGAGGTSSATGGAGGSNSTAGAGNATSAGGSAGFNTSALAGSSGANSGGATTSIGGADVAGASTGVAGATSSSAGNSGSAGEANTAAPPDDNQSSCSMLRPGTSNRRGFEGWLLAAAGIVLVAVRRAARGRFSALSVNS